MDTQTLLKVPEHIAIIMDGNGRWAQQRGLPRSEGHKAGTRNVIAIADRAYRIGVKALTLYAFSTENWKRSEMEVSALMSILGGFLDEHLASLQKHNIRLRTIGETDRLPMLVRGKLKSAIAQTASNTAGTLVFALSYGARTEIVSAAKSLAEKVKNGLLKLSDIDETAFAAELYAPDIPDPDLIIRTSDEWRLSNFLLWQAAYSEFAFTPTLWPDLSPDEFEELVNAYRSRQRRFGGR